LPASTPPFESGLRAIARSPFAERFFSLSLFLLLDEPQPRKTQWRWRMWHDWWSGICLDGFGRQATTYPVVAGPPANEI
jgi:hypothetical protein